MISKLKTIFTSKIRLWIEYALLAALLAVAGFCLAVWLENQRMSRDLGVMGDRLVVVEDKARTQDETIGTLRALREVDSKALAALHEDYRTLARNDLNARKRLTTLEKSNEAVRDYLNQRLPDDLICLLDPTCKTDNGDSDGTPSSSGVPVAPVRSPGG